MASPLAILPLPPSRFRPLAPYCPLSWHLTARSTPRLAPYRSPRTGWHPTAHPAPAGTLPLTPHRLAPYCYSPAGTLLLIVVGWHPLCLVAPLAALPLRSFSLSSVTPSRGIALPPWLCAMLGNDVMTCPTVHHGFWWALSL